MSKKENKKSLDKHVSQKRPRASRWGLSTIVITAVITASITLAVQQLYVFINTKFFKPQIVAEIATVKAVFRKVDRERATYVIERLEDTLTGESNYFTAMAFPPGTEVSTLSMPEYMAKISLANRGWRVAKNIKLVIFQPGNLNLEVLVPKIADAEIHDFNRSSQESPGKMVLIRELGKKQSIVITVILEGTAKTQKNADFNISGYLIFDEKYLELMRSPLVAIIQKYSSPENMLLTGVKFKVIKTNSSYKGETPSTFLYTRDAKSESEAFDIFESSTNKDPKIFPWEQKRP